MQRSSSSRALAITLVLTLAAAALAGCGRKSVSVPPAPPAASGGSTGGASGGSGDTPGGGSAGGSNSSGTAVALAVEPVFFGYDSHTLDESSRAVLDRNARALRDNPNANVLIEGHCDERGTAEYNMALGELRAQAASRYLIDAGVTPSRISTISYGKERPFEEGNSESAWAKNRRAHLVLR